MSKWKIQATLLTWTNVNRSKLREFTKTAFRGTLTTVGTPILTRLITKVHSKSAISARLRRPRNKGLLTLNLQERHNSPLARMDRMSQPWSLRTLQAWSRPAMSLSLIECRRLLTIILRCWTNPRPVRLTFKSTITEWELARRAPTDSRQATATATWPTCSLLNYLTSTLRDREEVLFQPPTATTCLTKPKKWLKHWESQTSLWETTNQTSRPTPTQPTKLTLSTTPTQLQTGLNLRLRCSRRSSA